MTNPIDTLSLYLGPKGDPGKSVLNGTGAPSAGTGLNGDFYLDTAASRLYGPKTAGAWGSGVSLVGANGTNGTNGTNGANGVDYTIALVTSSATSGYTIPAGTTIAEFTAPSGAIAANLPATTPAVGAAGSVLQVAMPTSNAGGLTLSAPAGSTIQGAASFLLPGSNGAPPTSADRLWQIRVVATNTWRVG